MDEHAKGTEPRKRGYEESDANIAGVFWFAAAVVVLIVMGVLASTIAFRFFVHHQSLGPPASPFEDVRQLPPEPRLQTNAREDLRRYHQDEDKVLGTYGWVDQKANVVRIPIDRAMDLMLQKGYPVRGSTPAATKAAKSPAGQSQR